MGVNTVHADPETVTGELSNYLITGGADKKVRIWDLRKLAESGGARAIPRRSAAAPNAGAGRSGSVHGLLSAES